MSTNRYDARRDENEKDIIKRLREVGCSIVQISKRDVCDLLVGFKGVTYMIEVKSKKGKLSSGQTKFIDSWRGRKPVVVYSVEEAFDVIGVKL